jgi:uncharacterized RDD family membrane protein YckC
MEDLEKSEFDEIETTVYPLISDRYKAVFIDAMVIIGFWILFSYLFSAIGSVHENVKMAAYIFSVALYEPLCISLFGATLGHYSGGMMVRKENDLTKKVNIFAALLRYVIKATLGIISLLTINKENKGRGLHDMVSGSIVLFTEK